jgi:hypothetical protein
MYCAILHLPYLCIEIAMNNGGRKRLARVTLQVVKSAQNVAQPIFSRYFRKTTHSKQFAPSGHPAFDLIKVRFLTLYPFQTRIDTCHAFASP